MTYGEAHIALDHMFVMLLHMYVGHLGVLILTKT